MLGWARGTVTQRASAQAGCATRRHGTGGMGTRALGARALGARALGAQAMGGRLACKHGVGVQGRAAGRTVRAGHGRPGRWMGAQAGPPGPVLVHCAPGSVLARFLDPIRLGIFLSHHMNTVHCKINFRKKKFIKFK